MLALLNLFLVDYLDLMVQVMVVTEAALMAAAVVVLVMVIVVELVELQEPIILLQLHLNLHNRQ